MNSAGLHSLPQQCIYHLPSDLFQSNEAPASTSAPTSRLPHASPQNPYPSLLQRTVTTPTNLQENCDQLLDVIKNFNPNEAFIKETLLNLVQAIEDTPHSSHISIYITLQRIPTETSIILSEDTLTEVLKKLLPLIPQETNPAYTRAFQAIFALDSKVYYPDVTHTINTFLISQALRHQNESAFNILRSILLLGKKNEEDFLDFPLSPILEKLSSPDTPVAYKAFCLIEDFTTKALPHKKFSTATINRLLSSLLNITTELKSHIEKVSKIHTRQLACIYTLLINTKDVQNPLYNLGLNALASESQHKSILALYSLALAHRALIITNNSLTNTTS